MEESSGIFVTAIQLILQLDPALVEIVTLSLYVSITAVIISSIISIPLGATLAVAKFPGRMLIISLLNAFMGLPPVVVGLLIYLLLSRAGPLGDLSLLFTPEAMVIAQICLITPIVAALSRQTIQDSYHEYQEQFRALGISRLEAARILIVDNRTSLLTAVIAGFGRAIAEVGAVLIVGGNINHVTRVMTTTIALETKKGNLELGLALGIMLILTSIFITSIVTGIRHSHKVHV